MEEQLIIVKQFAPIIAHKITNEWSAADQITRIDLLGDIKSLRGNPKYLIENTDRNGSWKIDDPEAAVYYSICETDTHYFLLYTMYHPMDWWKRLKPTNLYDLIRDGVDEHAHDMEGVLMVIRKEPTLILDAMVTVAHHDFYLYTEPIKPKTDGTSYPWKRRSLKVRRFNETIDGNIWIDRGTKRPKVYIQSRGHGIYGDHKHWGGGDEICYYLPRTENNELELINPKDSSHNRKYDLIDLCAPGGLWDHRYDKDVFRQRSDGRWGFVALSKVTKGDLTTSSANPPWSWNDKNDPSPIGEITTDPATFIGRYAQGLGPLSYNYIYNPYLNIKKGDSNA